MKKFKTNMIVSALVLVSLILVSFGSFAQKKTLMTEKDGFKWYKLEQNGKVGAQSTSGVTFIPLSRGYTYISYVYPYETADPSPFPPYVGWFSVRKNSDSYGACDKNGREIVAPGRYDMALYRDEDGYVYCMVELNGRWGLCDENGREVMVPRYKTLVYSDDEHVFKYEDASGKWVSLGNPLNKNGGTGYASTTTGNSSSYSSGTSSRSNDESGLLYEGEYTIQYSQSRDLINGYSTGQYSSDETERVKIYEDRMEICFGTNCKYKSTNSSGERVYEGTQSIGGTITAYVSPSYNIRLVDESWFNGMHMKVGIPVVKGRSLMPEYSGGYNSGTSSGYQPTNNNSGSAGTSGGSHQVKKPHADYKDCHICHGSGVCSTCGGKGWYNNPYGTGRVECSNCSKTGKCRTCNGTGKVLGPTKWD